jgi:hypothetical protein
MKTIFLTTLSFTFVLMTFQSELGAQNKSVLVDTNGNTLKPGTKYVYQQNTKDGKIMVFQKNKKDINLLILELKKSNVSEKKFLDPKFWAEDSCTMRDGSCDGSCDKGDCSPTDVGHGKSCGCI